jgi:hypothetical protein
MTIPEIPLLRLNNQGLARPHFSDPAQVVSWLGAVQAQDFAAVKWALGLRLQGAPADAAVERAFNAGDFLRTHVMRPTWHFVAPADLRWLLALTAPRVHAVNAAYYRKNGLDDDTLRRSRAVIEQALHGGQALTRDELRDALERSGIPTQGGQRMAYLVMHAELEGVLCSGPRRGRQFTYMLLDERVPPFPALPHDEALAELVRRYFTSHGPADARDFAWWSGLTVADARRGIEINGDELVSERMAGRQVWFSASQPPPLQPDHAAYLLPVYDEFGISYRDHGDIFDPADTPALLFFNILLLRGRLVGSWRRDLAKSAVQVQADAILPLSDADLAAFDAAARRYGEFLGLPVSMQWT